MADGRKVNFPLNENGRTHLNDVLGPITARTKKCAKMFLILIMNTCICTHIFTS